MSLARGTTVVLEIYEQREPFIQVGVGVKQLKYFQIVPSTFQ